MYIYGKNSVYEYLKENNKVYKSLVIEGFSDEKVLNMLEKKNIGINYLTKKEFYKFDKFNHQGIILDIPDFEYTDYHDLMDSIDDVPFLVMLDHLEDVHNLGAIIRTCEAAGVHGIIIPKDRSVSVNATVMKVSSGALNHMSVCMVSNLNNTIKDLKKRNVWVVGTEADGSDYSKTDLNIPICLVIGSEGRGMSELVRRNCDMTVSLPMKGKINSLNASVAAGILIYEIVKQRG